jgi:DNA-binding MarR family transcriptional regulator
MTPTQNIPDDQDAVTPIRAALHRKALADARQRAALARRLGLTDSEVLAVQHLARAGELTPGQLGSLLQLSSGGTTGLIQRLQRAGHVSRHAHPHDRRSAVVRLTPGIAAWAAEAWAPFVAELDALASGLSEGEREVVQRFLEATADAAERHADRLASDADASAQDALAVPLPALWA